MKTNSRKNLLPFSYVLSIVEQETRKEKRENEKTQKPQKKFSDRQLHFV
uniref:Uncharacterized protein n=1 Tax=Ciona intestinalis TaxID=7719 RepID=H2XJP9_CIOIN